MRELSLFTGVGGGLLGTLLLGWKPVGYVEWNEYCQRVIAQRIADGILPTAPIFGDVQAFIGEGYAASYTGMVDVITGGFPCQPFSSAGKRLGADDPRNMWPATAQSIRIIQPRFCFLENVPSLLSSGYFGTIIADLAACRYGVRWGVLSACAFGAPHPRERLFILAYADGIGRRRGRDRKRGAKGTEWRIPQKWSQGVIAMQRSLQTTAWNESEHSVLGIPDGLGSKLERVKSIGNGQVPSVVRAAWHLLSEGLDL